MANPPLQPLFPILVVDDEEHALKSFELTLRSGGLNHILLCSDGVQVLEILSRQEVEIILLDLVMPGLSGEKVLSGLKERYPEIPVIMVTGTNEVETAVRCMQKGAFDYVLKPVHKQRLLPAVQRAIEIRQLRHENARLTQFFFSESLEHPELFSNILTQSAKMQAVFRYCEAIAGGNSPVLITGETGVGKELIAEVLHSLSGRRGEFVAVNAAGLDDNVFSDALFGHVKGAFTDAVSVRTGQIERAAGGTLFLDEIGDLSLSSQVKLLRLLDNHEYFPLGSDVAKPARVRFLWEHYAFLKKPLRSKIGLATFLSGRRQDHGYGSHHSWQTDRLEGTGSDPIGYHPTMDSGPRGHFQGALPAVGLAAGKRPPQRAGMQDFAEEARKQRPHHLAAVEKGPCEPAKPALLRSAA